MHMLLRPAAVSAAAGTLLLIAPALAGAETRVFADQAGDTGIAADVTRVKVRHSDYRVAARVAVGDLRVGDVYRFWLETDPDDPGPEFKLVLYPNSDGIIIKRVESFADPGDTFTCDGFRATADAYGDDVVTFSVPRRCIGRPDSVRLSVRAAFDHNGSTVVDWAPATRHFFGWVDRG